MTIPATTTTTAQAVDALLKWKKTQSDSQNPQLLPQDDFIYLILSLKKIPQARINPNKLPLPHPLITPNSFPEICLIIDDRHLTSKAAKQKIKDESICVTKVIKLSKLKTDYKPFESKRKLCDSYEMLFADKRVIPLLPKLLGKQFFRKKKKLPLGVDLSHKNWKEQIERGCCSGLLFFRTGTCCVIRVAKVSMERDEIVENVSAAIDGALEFVPKGVRSLHLKFSDSVALPLYQCLPDIIKLRRIEGVKDGVIEDDEVEEQVENGDGLVEEEKPSAKAKDDGVSGKKKRKGNVVQVENKKKSNKEKKVNHDWSEYVDEPDHTEIVLKDLKYAGSHEWAKVEGNCATIGITDHAQDHLGDVVYVELPEVGAEVTQGSSFGAVESVKATSDINSPVSGKVTEVNEELSSSPGLVNGSPYENGWIMKVEISDKNEVNSLMDSEQYSKFCEEEDNH